MERATDIELLKHVVTEMLAATTEALRQIIREEIAAANSRSMPVSMFPAPPGSFLARKNQALANHEAKKTKKMKRAA